MQEKLLIFCRSYQTRLQSIYAIFIHTTPDLLEFWDKCFA